MSNLPTAWTIEYSTTHENHYYFNGDTGLTQWTHPSDGICDSEGNLERMRVLPIGWTSEYCKEQKLWYFYCVTSGHSQWTHPSYGLVFPSESPEDTSDEYEEYDKHYNEYKYNLWTKQL
jgi:hypothetical protein